MRWVAGVCLVVLANAADWPEFRGPGGQGHAGESGLPITWSESKNISWKTVLPGKAWSSPVIQGDTVWLTTATQGGQSLRLLTVDRVSGRLLKDIEVFQQPRPPGIHEKNSYASPSPIVAGDRVYVHYGNAGTACLRTDGSVVWKTQLRYEHGNGSGGSPVLWKDLLILNCDGVDQQYVVALDAATGAVRWKQSRGGTAMAFATPLAIETADGPQLVSPGAHRTVSYDPGTGRELWHVKYGDQFSNVPRPVFAHGLVYLCTGFYGPHLLAVRPDGSGDVTQTKVTWRTNRNVPNTPSPLVVGEELYLVSDAGIASALDARSGAVRWQQRLGAEHSASPLYADGRIYFTGEDGRTTVIAPGAKFERLAVNQLDGRFLASIAVSGGAMFLRSETHLYKVEAPRAAAR